MICSKCKRGFKEKEIDESHDIPTYLWEGNRQGRKNQADKFGRHYLCRLCHIRYEEKMRTFLKEKAKWFAGIYFEENKEDGNTNTIKEP
jgi:hypothetical protein